MGEDVYSVLLEYDWPGNVRELENVLEQAVNWSNDELIDFHRIPNRFWEESENTDCGPAQKKEQVVLQDEILRAERELLEKTLLDAGGNRSKAAQLLGISRSAFYRRLEKHGIT